MCVRLHFNGNDIGQSTHISVSLVLMRGDYDAILNWPFDFQVIFCLYDLSHQKNHIVESFQSDTKSTSSQRPQTELNIGEGISRFIPLSTIQQNNNPFVCDDSIYMKVMVRKNPLPTSILPDIMNINPALPMYIQEDLIEKYRTKLNKLVLTLWQSS